MIIPLIYCHYQQYKGLSYFFRLNRNTPTIPVHKNTYCKDFLAKYCDQTVDTLSDKYADISNKQNSDVSRIFNIASINWCDNISNRCWSLNPINTNNKHKATTIVNCTKSSIFFIILIPLTRWLWPQIIHYSIYTNIFLLPIKTTWTVTFWRWMVINYIKAVTIQRIMNISNTINDKKSYHTIFCHLLIFY